MASKNRFSGKVPLNVAVPPALSEISNENTATDGRTADLGASDYAGPGVSSPFGGYHSDITPVGASGAMSAFGIAKQREAVHSRKEGDSGSGSVHPISREVHSIRGSIPDARSNVISGGKLSKSTGEDTSPSVDLGSVELR